MKQPWIEIRSGYSPSPPPPKGTCRAREWTGKLPSYRPYSVTGAWPYTVARSLPVLSVAGAWPFSVARSLPALLGRRCLALLGHQVLYRLHSVAGASRAPGCYRPYRSPVPGSLGRQVSPASTWLPWHFKTLSPIDLVIVGLILPGGQAIFFLELDLLRPLVHGHRALVRKCAVHPF